MPAGTLYHGVPLLSDETLGPLLESIIVVRLVQVVGGYSECFFSEYIFDQNQARKKKNEIEREP